MSKLATCWLVDMRQSQHGQTVPSTSTEASVDQGCEGPPPTPARPSAEHSAHAVGPTASHTGCHASQGLSSTQHSARLPVTRPERTYRRGLATASRGCWRHPGPRTMCPGEVPEENLLHFFWHRLWEGLCEALAVLKRVASKNPLNDVKSLGNSFRLKASALARRGIDELKYVLWLTL